METKPFHETIVRAAKTCCGSQFASIKLQTLIYLVMQTKITENHDQILEAFRPMEDINFQLFCSLEDKLQSEKEQMGK
ncbi:MAG: hypothetical protein US50_C0025G0008 [Candidatus Nomurabacteria bacterium GW2011_GWB1_37_5]|uniref:Uncharacterized protein n=1 Tax=Candidatus Nomurabacteria bacterium GW2011_GWB1_37_5 TaxID=1618742 RepID=A0A0G0JEE5_9BACT|nr:MAG: hypothetical protein US50_C0025G0008 [Candidatus Nomurabacteria bacterium GW2011_GWB1_37_5]